MEARKVESERQIKCAETAINKGERANALQFLNLAWRMRMFFNLISMRKVSINEPNLENICLF